MNARVAQWWVADETRDTLWDTSDRSEIDIVSFNEGGGRHLIQIEETPGNGEVSADVVARGLAIWHGAKVRSAAEIAEEIWATRGETMARADIERCEKIANTETALLAEGLIPSEAFERLRIRTTRGETNPVGEDTDRAHAERVLAEEAARLPERHLGQGGIGPHDRIRAPVGELTADIVESELEHYEAVVHPNGALGPPDGVALPAITAVLASAIGAREAEMAVYRRATAERLLDAPPESEAAHARQWLMEACGLNDQALAERRERAERCAARHVKAILGIEVREQRRACAVLAEQGVCPKSARMGRYLGKIAEGAERERRALKARPAKQSALEHA